MHHEQIHVYCINMDGIIYLNMCNCFAFIQLLFSGQMSALLGNTLQRIYLRVQMAFEDKIRSSPCQTGYTSNVCSISYSQGQGFTHSQKVRVIVILETKWKHNKALKNTEKIRLHLSRFQSSS